MVHVIAATNARDAARAAVENAREARASAKLAFDAASAAYVTYERELVRLRARFAATNADIDTMIDVRLGALPGAAHQAAAAAVEAASLYVFREAVPLADAHMATLAARMALLGDA